MRRYLFIGGVADGQQFDVDEEQVFVRFILNDEDQTKFSQLAPKVIATDYVLYEKRAFAQDEDNGEFISVYKHNELTDTAMLWRLMRGYRPKTLADIIEVARQKYISGTKHARDQIFDNVCKLIVND